MKNTINLIFLLVIVSFIGCEDDYSNGTSENQSDLGVVRLENEELEHYAALLEGRSPQLYQSLIFRKNPNDYFEIQEDSMEAYFISRPIEYLKISSSGLLSDGNRNQIFRNSFRTGDSLNHYFSITVSSNRDVVIGLDLNQDEVLDLVVQRVGDDLISLLANEETEEVLRCVESLNVNSSSLFESILDCLSQFGNGSGGGWNHLNRLLEDFLDPKCDEQPSPVTDLRSEMRTLAGIYNLRAEDVENSGNSEKHLNLARLLSETADLLFELAEFDGITEEASAFPSEDAATDFKDYLNDISEQITRNIAEIVVLSKEFEGDPLINPENPTGNIVSHPRCQQRDTDTQRGTLFSNKEFCPDADFINCFRKQNSVLYALTEGQCFVQEGPEGGRMLICKDTDRNEGTPILPPDEENSPYNPNDNDDLDQNAPQGSNGQIADEYINLTPLGDFIIGLCAKGGCPRGE